MKIADVKFELEQVFLLDAADVISARQRAQIIHHATNISAAGDEVEVAVRRSLKKRLPGGIHVGHGHVIDQSCHCSGQLDVVLADSFGCPIFFQTESGAEFFPYESVYALGEIKSGYKSNDVQAFVAKVKKMKAELTRAQTPSEFISTGRGRGFHLGGMTSLDPRPFKNPLFSFMIFADSKNFHPRHIKQLYKDFSPADLPNILCFLDQGILAYARFDSADNFSGIHYEPQFAHLYEEPGMYSQWAWIQDSHDRFAPATHLGWLYFALSSHIRHCMLMPPELMEYGKHVLSSGATSWKALEFV